MGIGGIRKQNVENLVYKSSLFRILSAGNKLQLPNFFQTEINAIFNLLTILCRLNK